MVKYKFDNKVLFLFGIHVLFKSKSIKIKKKAKVEKRSKKKNIHIYM